MPVIVPLLVIQNATGQPNPGVILQRKQVEEITEPASDRYDIHIFESHHFDKENHQGMKDLANTCFFHLERSPFSVFLGGDHYTSLGTVLGSLKKYGNEFRILWIDAHADIHEWETSPSKNLHGMPLRLLMTHDFKDIPRLKPEQLMYVGLRSVESEEWDFIHSNRIPYLTAAELRKDPELAYLEILDFMGESRVHLSLDVDSLDPAVMSSTGTVMPGGLSLEHLYKIVEDVSPHLFAVDVMEYNPTIGTSEERAVSKETMKEIFYTLGNIQNRNKS